MFGLKPISKPVGIDLDIEDNNLEDDFDIISPPHARPGVKQVNPGELPENIDKLLNSCDGELTDTQMTMVHDLLSDMRDTFMDLHVNLVGTDTVGHYIDTADTCHIWIPP